MLIALDEHGYHFINPDDVTRVEVNYDRDTVLVIMRDGERITLRHDYGKTTSDTARRIRKAINENSTVKETS